MTLGCAACVWLCLCLGQPPNTRKTSGKVGGSCWASYRAIQANCPDACRTDNPSGCYRGPWNKVSRQRIGSIPGCGSLCSCEGWLQSSRGTLGSVSSNPRGGRHCHGADQAPVRPSWTSAWSLLLLSWLASRASGRPSPPKALRPAAAPCCRLCRLASTYVCTFSILWSTFSILWSTFSILWSTYSILMYTKST